MIVGTVRGRAVAKALSGLGQELGREIHYSVFPAAEVEERPARGDHFWTRLVEGDERDRYGREILVAPRLGQGTFRVAVIDAYDRACAVTTEDSLPALEASHIRPYGEGGEHAVTNGILMRSDIHRLFDAGYVTITRDHRFVRSYARITAWDFSSLLDRNSPNSGSVNAYRPRLTR